MWRGRGKIGVVSFLHYFLINHFISKHNLNQYLVFIVGIKQLMTNVNNCTKICFLVKKGPFKCTQPRQKEHRSPFFWCILNICFSSDFNDVNFKKAWCNPIEMKNLPKFDWLIKSYMYIGKMHCMFFGWLSSFFFLLKKIKHCVDYQKVIMLYICTKKWMNTFFSKTIYCLLEQLFWG